MDQSIYTLPGRALKDIPCLETDRIRLRATNLDDYEAILAKWQDERYIRYVGNRTRSPAEIWGSIQRNIGSWAIFGFGYLTIADKSTDACIGECGMMIGMRTEVSPPLPKIPEIGWGISAAYWGQGIAKEAAGLLMDWAIQQDPNIPVQCIIDPDNIASERVALSIGMRLKGTAYWGEDEITHVYERALLPTGP